MSLKIVSVVDKTDSAIDRLAKGMARFNDNISYIVCDIHPKRSSPEQLERFEREARDADIIDMQYFRSAFLLLARYPWLADKKKILAAHNPYSITESDWNEYDYVVANNQDIYKRLGDITTAPIELIGNTIDTDFWTYGQDWEPNNHVIMVSARIEAKKGILPVAIACGDAGLHLDLVGSVSSPAYMDEIMATGAVTFHEKISDEALRDLYHASTIYMLNSVDNYESSNQGLLEAMITGVPVLARNVGIAPELNNGENMVIHEGDPEDVGALTELLTDMMNDKKHLGELRDKAQGTAKVRSHERRAYQYQMLYRKVLNPNTKPVSIVVPVCDRPETTRKCLDAIAKQSYENIELIVADDGLSKENQQIVQEFAKFVSFPVRYIRTARLYFDQETDEIKKEYGLARARNMATDLATGEIIVYCDVRQIMEPDCVGQFVIHSKPRYWLYGNKGSSKQVFLENLSSIYRKDIVRMGLFSELGQQYGFQSEYCRKVAKAQGLKTEYCGEAKSMPSGKSGNRNNKRAEIIKSKNQLWRLFDAQTVDVGEDK